tara:strand:- start:5040 stop:5237 length:198 start_codon:yes stop_codon:yes gene_type:complete
MRTIKKPKTMGFKKTAYSDSGFRDYMTKEENILTPNEFDNFLKDPKRKHLVIENYKNYLKSQLPF